MKINKPLTDLFTRLDVDITLTTGNLHRGNPSRVGLVDLCHWDVSTD